MSKRQAELKVVCIYKKDGKKLENIIKDVFLRYVKGELSKEQVKQPFIVSK